LGNERVRDVEDGLARSVVLLERDDCRARKLLREVEDVAEVRAAEGIDALRVVTDDRDIVVRTAHRPEDSGLEEIGVLILVDQQMVVHAGDLLGEGRRGVQHHQPEQQQIVIVDEVAAGLAVRIVGIDANDVVRELGEARELFLEDALHRKVGVDVTRVDVA
jgi:hypothetical protein